MQAHVFESSIGAAWGDGFSHVLAQARQWVDSDAGALGLLRVTAPSPDEFLAAAGVKPDAIEDWCAEGFRKDPLLKKAKRSGAAAGRTALSRPGPPLASMQGLVAVQPVTGTSSNHAWVLILGRKGRAFTDAELEAASQALRWLAAGFDHPREPWMGRAILGDDARLIHADPMTETWFREVPEALDELSEMVPQVVAQRWPERAADDVPHDLTLSLGDRPAWVRVREGGVKADGQITWDIELRPQDDPELPAIGLVGDDRVAKALAYQADQCLETPSLNEVAGVVETSSFHFHRLFSAEAQISPKQFVLRHQIMHAKWRLRATRLAIGQVALDCGFASHGHFTSTFHKLVGLSPSEYRESL